ncbi:MAG: serine hydrolase [Planctomycetota bacterium]
MSTKRTPIIVLSVLAFSFAPWVAAQISQSGNSSAEHSLADTELERKPFRHLQLVQTTSTGDASENEVNPNGEPSDSYSLAAPIDELANKILEQQRIPGMAVVVVEAGKTVFQRGYGLANVESKVEVDPDRTLFRIGSVSKALTFLTLTRLIDQGKLDRTDDVQKFISSIQNRGGFAEPVTIDHLLTHTAGFDQVGTNRQIFEPHLGLAERKAKRPGLFAFLNDNNLRRVTAPGAVFRYDTYGVTLAGAIIEKVTQKPFAQAMRDELFRPLGMDHSFVEVDDSHRPQLATGYGWQGERFIPRPYEVYVTTPASSIDATPADMGRLLEALTAGGANANGRLLSEATTSAVLSPQFRCHEEFVGITHGFFESFTSEEATTTKHLRTIGHGGNMDGYRSALTIVPEKKLGIFLIANRSPESGGGNVDFRPLLDLVLNQFHDAPTKTAHSVKTNDSVELDEYAGDYHYGVYCHTPTAADLSLGAWRRPSARSVSVTEAGLQIGDQLFVARGDDVFVQSDGERLAYFGRNDEGQITHFVYSTSPDTFEKASTGLPYPTIDSLAQRVADISSSEGLEQALKFLDRNKSSESYYCREDELNRLGYLFLERNLGKAAISVFELNVKRFPKSWNAYDSLAEAYAATDERQLAIQNYQRSIELNPGNEAGKLRLAELLN